MNEFVRFRKIPRLNRECVITEKIDGTNGQVIVGVDGSVRAASRNRLITPDDDNYGFAAWVAANEADLRNLGPGNHYGEWWGAGIGRRHPTVTTRRFSLFNTNRWASERPSCCHVVPVIAWGTFSTDMVERAIETLRAGSLADPDCKRPEGLIVYHTAANQYFKVTLENDHEHKGVKN